VPAVPGHDLIHLGKESFAVCLLALAGEFEVGKAHLAYGRLYTCMRDSPRTWSISASRRFTLAQAAMEARARKMQQQNSGIDYATGYLVLKFYASILTIYRLPE
jgi:hypothetical protein